MFVLFGSIIGAIMASALQCLVMRQQKNQRWSAGFSCCDGCGRRLSGFENIPILGYIVQKGSSKCCKATLSPLYLLVEILGALMGGAIGYFAIQFGWSWIIVTSILAMVVLYTIVSDGLYQWIALPPIIIGGIVGMVYSADWQSSVVGLLLGITFFGIQWLITRGKGIGAGDIFLGGAMGLSLGAFLVLPAIFFGYILALGPAISALATKRAGLKTKISIGAYLALSWMIIWFLQESLLAFLQDVFVLVTL